MDLRALPLVALAACGFAPTGESFTLAEQLTARAYLDVAADSQLDVTAVAHGLPLAIAPTIVGGEVVARTTADGYLLIEDLTLPLADVTVPAGVFGPTPVRFTDLVVSLGTQLAVPLPPDGEVDVVAGTGRADLILDWAMVDPDGIVRPLGLRRAPRAPFTVAIHRALDGSLHAELGARTDAVVIAGDAALTDVALAVVSASTAE